ncbi:MAG: exodeoxyribonuclease VII large subunit [Denitrovibrio sp.]|nr:MAG: exodeoxyribonuclease VII large subunit [Denitrovibrio sp.]
MKKFTVTEITRAVKGLLENTFADNIAVKGEISSFSRSPAGHLYFVLKDQKAQIKCVMFRGMADKNKGYDPKNGDSVEAIGELTVYEAGGNYQLLVKKLDYDSVGLFWQLFEEVKKKLEAEGLFEDELKKPTPYLPKRVAIITSPTGAAIKDFLITMKNDGAVFEVDVWGVPVQGKDAIAPIVSALSKAGAMTDRYDALVLMRGGGSLDDLAVFNEEYVARALAACKVPTISAIGHERDISICDFVADKRVATPTAAASFLGEGYSSAGRELDLLGKRLTNIMNQKVMNANQRLDMLMQSVGSASPKKRVESDRRQLSYLIKSLSGHTLQMTDRKKAKLNELIGIMSRISPKAQIERQKNSINDIDRRLKDALFNKKRSESDRINILLQKVSGFAPDRKAENYKNKLDNLVYRMKSAVKSEVTDNKSRLAPLTAKLEALDPHNILSKGYSFVMLDGKPIKSVFDISLQDELEIRLNDGYINSFVTGKKVSEENDG